MYYFVDVHTNGKVESTLSNESVSVLDTILETKINCEPILNDVPICIFSNGIVIDFGAVQIQLSVYKNPYDEAPIPVCYYKDLLESLIDTVYD